MKVAIVGTGYVGLPTGVSFAEHGNEVTCIDSNPEKIALLRQGIPPIHEEGLPEAMAECIEAGNLRFTDDLKEGLLGAAAVFCAVGTPETADGSADMQYVYKVAEDVGKLITDYTVFVNKSTVPVGTAAAVREIMAQQTDVEFDVVSNPEFMAEGVALRDVRRPSRIVVGTSSERAREVMSELYKPYVRNGRPIFYMSEASAELTKYGANGFLATKVSFYNELATLAARVGADIEDIRPAMAADPRIGNMFNYVSPGWGGSCFPKDSRALIHIANKHGFDFKVMSAADKANDEKMLELPKNVINYFGGDIEGKKIAVWGLAFKKETDDVRESPALVIIDKLLEGGAIVAAYDPAAEENAAKVYDGNENISFGPSRYSVLEDADALVIATDWEVFTNPNLDRLKAMMKSPAVFDGRNMIDIEMMKKAGVYYQGNGRPVVKPDA